MKRKKIKLFSNSGLHICLLALLGSILSLAGCFYSLKGYNIGGAETYYVSDFKILAQNAPATINQIFVEALKDKISRESSLKFSEEEPHLEFNGTIQSFNVTAVSPLPNEQTAFNRLTITVNVEYINNLDPKDKWTRNFSHFEDFNASGDLLAIQDELINVIFKQILEDVFNQAFNNW